MKARPARALPGVARDVDRARFLELCRRFAALDRTVAALDRASSVTGRPVPEDLRAFVERYRPAVREGLARVRARGFETELGIAWLPILAAVALIGVGGAVYRYLTKAQAEIEHQAESLATIAATHEDLETRRRARESLLQLETLQRVKGEPWKLLAWGIILVGSAFLTRYLVREIRGRRTA